MEVISLGNMLVEVMRVHLDEPLDQPGSPRSSCGLSVVLIADCRNPGGLCGIYLAAAWF